MTALMIRKRADKSTETREVRFDEYTGKRKLVNPDTPGDAHEPWPLASVALLCEPPAELEMSVSYVALAVHEGWMELEDAEPVHRPGGPAENQWALTHTFMQASAIVMHFESGDVRYKVVHQPDKYVADGTDKTKVTPEHYEAGNTRVDGFYGLKLDTAKKG